MKNITVAISTEGYHATRVWCAQHRTSLSKTVAYILETLPKIPIANHRFPLPKPSAARSSEGAKQ